MNLPLSVRCTLLQLLSASPAYGLELIERARDATDGALRLHQGVVYPTLAALEREGLIRTVPTEERDDGIGGKPRHTYRITAAGRRVAARHRTAVLAIVAPEAL